MTDIIEVAKLCGASIFHADKGCETEIQFNRAELQAFADHYRKEGAAGANNTIAELEAELIGEKDSYLILHNVNEALHAKLAATELVAEQMREALDKSDSYIRSTDNGGFSALPVIKNNKAVLQLQPSLSALRELPDVVRYQFLRRMTNEPELIDLLNSASPYPETPEEFDAAIDAAMASELRAKGE
jgi:hypothetical protein